MPSLNDAIHAVVGPGQLNDQLVTYWKLQGATGNTLNDLEQSFLFNNTTGLPGEIPTDLNDLWYTFLRQKGFTGAVNDMKLAWWVNGGNVV